MQKKKSFLLYTESLSVLEELTKDQIADLFLAIKDYQNGVEPKLNGLMKAVFLPFKNYFDENAEKYAKVCEKRRNAGSLGGKANASKSKQMRYESESESDSESDVSKETEKKEIFKEKKADQKTQKKLAFEKPTVEEVAIYCRERGNAVDPEGFCDFYEAKGWRIGKEPMKNWKAAVRTWEKRNRRNGITQKKPVCDYEALLNLDLEK